MPLTFESAEEREFWMNVLLQAVGSALAPNMPAVAAKLADDAVEELRDRVPAVPDWGVQGDLPPEDKPATVAAPLPTGPKLTAAQVAERSVWPSVGQSMGLRAEAAIQADKELSEFFARPVKVHVR